MLLFHTRLGRFHLVYQEKQEEGVKSQFVSSIADAKERIKTSRKILGQEHAEVRYVSMSVCSSGVDTTL